MTLRRNILYIPRDISAGVQLPRPKEVAWKKKKHNTTSSGSPGTEAPKQATVKEEIKSLWIPRTQKLPERFYLNENPNATPGISKQKAQHPLDPPFRTSKLVKKSCFATNLETQNAKPSTSPRTPRVAAKDLKRTQQLYLEITDNTRPPHIHS